MIVIVHGYDGSSEGHWQRWLHERLVELGHPVAFPDLPAPLEPRCDEWVDALARIVQGSPTQVRFVAHSLGVWAVDHYLTRHGIEGVEAALLVAPPSPWSLFEPIQSFLPPPRSREKWAPLASRSLLVGSNDDHYAGEDELIELAERLGVELRILPGAGHINRDAGFGPFPLALAWSLGEALPAA